MDNSGTLLELKGVTKQYDETSVSTVVLKGVDLCIEEGEMVAIVGPSGCGKSTLLNLIGALDRPTSGSITFDNQDLLKLNDTELADFRNRSVGFVFQLHHLLPQCSVLENVLIPTLVNKGVEQPRDRAIRLLDRVGLSERLSYKPGQLSGGERQRVAVVRALINQPKILLADEPTGSLNRDGAENLTQLLLELNREEGITFIVVTHSMTLANMMGRVLELSDGALISESGNA